MLLKLRPVMSLCKVYVLVIIYTHGFECRTAVVRFHTRAIRDSSFWY